MVIEGTVGRMSPGWGYVADALGKGGRRAVSGAGGEADDGVDKELDVFMRGERVVEAEIAAAVTDGESSVEGGLQDLFVGEGGDDVDRVVSVG